MSQWATDPVREYSLGNYGRMALELISQLDIDSMRWIGVSMGGALGLMLAGGELRDSISHLVLNDIGPVAPSPAQTEQGGIMLAAKRQRNEFVTITEFKNHLRDHYTALSRVRLSDMEWLALAEVSARRTDTGMITMHHDPAILEGVEQSIADMDQWPQYDRTKAKTLVLHGTESEVLTHEIAEQMTRRGPRARIVDFEGIGHAPFLLAKEEIQLISDFLAE